MNVNINFSAQQEDGDKQVEDTGLISDAGTAPSSLEISVGDDENIEPNPDEASSEPENIDIGAPPDWLQQAMASASTTEENVSERDDADGIEDGGSGPTE